jgi:anthranilate synthase component 2
VPLLALVVVTFGWRAAFLLQAGALILVALPVVWGLGADSPALSSRVGMAERKFIASRTPTEAGISLELVREMGAEVPILGVCLGHQAIGQAYGGVVKRAPYLMHGKVSPIRHDGEGLFEGLPNPLRATRYHSLIVERETLPEELQVTAETEDGLVMGLRHRVHPVYGVQFHPESILTEGGRELLQNFLRLPLPAAIR